MIWLKFAGEKIKACSVIIAICKSGRKINIDAYFSFIWSESERINASPKNEDARRGKNHIFRAFVKVFVKISLSFVIAVFYFAPSVVFCFFFLLVYFLHNPFQNEKYITLYRINHCRRV